MRGGRRSSFINYISRLWWIAHLLYDETNKNNPYELCEFFASRAMLFSSTNLVSNPEVAKGIIQCHYVRSKMGKDDGRYQFTEANKYLNYLGGVSIIDSYSRKEIYELTMDFLNKNFPN